MPIDELERAIGSLRHQLIFWTIVVAVGLVVEYAKPIKNFVVDTLRWLARTAERPRLSATIIGGLLITIGVMMEGWVEFRASDAETKLAKANDLSLTGARTAAANAEILARTLERENLQLRAAIADRDLTPDQQNKIGESLKKFSGRTVYIRSYPNDREAERLIFAIKAALEPRIHVEDRTGELMGASAPPGIILGIRIEPAQNDDRGFAEALVRAFRIDGKLSVDDLSPLGSGLWMTEILVGMKPVVLVDKLEKRAGDIGAPSKVARHLTPEQIGKITSKLKAFSGQKFNLFWFANDPEVNELAMDLVTACCAFGGAGWQLCPVNEQSLPTTMDGILVLLEPDADDRSRKAVRAFVSALRAVPLDVVGPREAADHNAVLSAKRHVLPVVGNAITVAIGKKP